MTGAPGNKSIGVHTDQVQKVVVAIVFMFNVEIGEVY